MSLSVAAMRPSVRSSSPSRQAPRSTSPRCVEPWCPASPSGWCPSQGLAGALTACHWLAGWGWRASEIGGIALSTTSLAVVYAVVEMGLSGSAVGQLLLSGHLRDRPRYGDRVVAAVPHADLVAGPVRRGIRAAAFVTLIMSTGLTFGTISATYGLTAESCRARSSRCSSAWSCSPRSCRPRSCSGSSSRTRRRPPAAPRSSRMRTSSRRIPSGWTVRTSGRRRRPRQCGTRPSGRAAGGSRGPCSPS